MSLRLLFDAFVTYVVPAVVGCALTVGGVYSWIVYHAPVLEVHQLLKLNEAALPMFLTFIYFAVVLFLATVCSWMVTPPQSAKCLTLVQKCFLASFALVVHIILLCATLPKPVMRMHLCEYVLPVATISSDIQFHLVALFTEIILHILVLKNLNLVNRVIEVAEFYSTLMLCAIFVSQKMLVLFSAVTIIHSVLLILITALQFLICLNISQDVDYYATILLLVVRWFRVGEIVLHVTLIYFLSDNIVAIASLGQIVNIVIYVCMKWNRMNSLP